MKAKIVHEIRHGLLVLRIRRVRSRQASRYIVSIHRLYRNGELWHESTRFGRDDIPFMRFLLDAAHTWIVNKAGGTEGEVV
jgi:hypothetical protein